MAEPLEVFFSPWAARVPWLDAHPERVLELLELLKDDPASHVGSFTVTMAPRAGGASRRRSDA